jgi:DNA repair exonuclease SbcCD ATPase subunit
MSQDIEIDPDSRTIKHYDSRTEQSIRDFIESGGKVLSRTDAITLLDEIDRLRKSREHHRQTALDISEDNDQLQKQIEEQNLRMQDLFQKAERLEKLVPPESERGPGFVGQGSWSVYAEKVVAERDYLQDALNRTLAERDDARDELNTLCGDIQLLKEESVELRDEVKQLGAMIAAKKEHTNTHFNDKDNFVGITGYGQFSLKQVDKDRWEIHMLNEKVTLYNKKGHRVRGHHNHDGDW